MSVSTDELEFSEDKTKESRFPMEDHTHKHPPHTLVITHSKYIYCSLQMDE